MSNLYLYVLCPRGPEPAELAMNLRGGPVFDAIERKAAGNGFVVRRSAVAADGSAVNHRLPTTRRKDQVTVRRGARAEMVKALGDVDFTYAEVPS